MMELRYDDQSSSPSAFRAHNSSPDSVIFTRESNFSLFSSASASVDRCSFASDAHDHDSEISPHLAGEDREVSSGKNLGRNRNKPTLHMRSRLHGKGDKAKDHKVDSDSDAEDDKQVSDSARSSFSLALRECQERTLRFDDPSRKSERRRTASFDFNNNATASSPRLGIIKKNSVAVRRSDAFPSPGTPNYRHACIGSQKGWSSERVPQHSIAGRRNSGVASLPFNANGRTLPSKWEDAERWIFSPVSGDNAPRPSVLSHQRRPKSKSGPLGPPGVAYHSQYSTAMPTFEARNMANFAIGSPLAADGSTFRGSGYHHGTFAIQPEPFIGRSVSVHGCSEMLSMQSSIGPQDEKLDGVKDTGTNISRAVSRRDMSTQMSPEENAISSLERRLSFTASLERRLSFTASQRPSCQSIVELETTHSLKLGVKDVQVDKQVTLTGRSKKSRFGIPGKRSSLDKVSSAWDTSDTTSSISKFKREEARIAAWENLQKAKAEAEIRKLEMELEKKRSSSMDKIMKKLRSAQKKAQGMRSSALANQSHQVATASNNAVVLSRTRQIKSLSGCFTCHHAF